MYTNLAKKILAKQKISEGDRIAVHSEGELFEGMLLPRPELAENGDTLVLKLDTGYNIGIRVDEKTKVELLEKGKAIKFKPTKTELPSDPKKPNVCIIGTGGTITGRVDYRTGAVSWFFEPADLINAAPEIKDTANISAELAFMEASENMHSEHWAKMAKLAEKELNSGKDGVVITHGTDMMHYSSAALSFMLQNLGKPVVLTGAQRSSDRGSTDGPVNLAAATRVAVSDIAEVSIVMHENENDGTCLINRGTKVRKMHTSRRDTFRPINEMPIGRVYPDGEMEFLNEYKKRKDGKVKAETKFEDKVSLIKVYPKMDAEILHFLMDKKYKGLVLEGTGLGHTPVNAKLLEAYERAQEEEIPIIITSQCIYGRVNQQVYSNLRELFVRGIVGGEDMLPEVAFIKLGWVLGQTKDYVEAKEMMRTNLAGEITQRTNPESFLF